MAKASDLRNKLGGLGGIGGGMPPAPKRETLSLDGPTESKLAEEEHKHAKPMHGGGAAPSSKAAKKLGGSGSSSSRPKV